MTSEWINITDRLPEFGLGVLVATKEGGVTAAVREKIDSGPKDGRWFWSGHLCGGYEWGFDFERGDVTHWMPLPKSPNLPKP